MIKVVLFLLMYHVGGRSTLKCFSVMKKMQEFGVNVLLNTRVNTREGHHDFDLVVRLAA